MPSLRTGRPRPLGMEPNRQPVSRSAEVLYLLCRGSQLEHPHMINVHYAAHQPGPTLRDVKTRLVALRGKGMPNSFSWSYKRNYKETFIWCDLFDDDFILPLTGSGEYVLKATGLFDAAVQDGEGLPFEYEQLPPVLSTRNSSPSKASRLSSRPEHLRVENDVSMAIKKSLLLINIPSPAAETNSMDLNKQIMNNLSHSKRAPAPPEVCSLEHSDVSSSGTYSSSTDMAENKAKHSSSSKSSSTSARSTEKTDSSSQTDAKSLPAAPSLNFVANQEKQCNAASQTAHAERKDVTAACNLEINATAMVSKKDEMTSISPSPMRTPRSEGSGRRRMWEKEVDKSAMYTQFVYHKSTGSEDERPDSVHSGSNLEDPYGVLKKVTRFGGSFRPGLCRDRVDVVDSTRTKPKLHFRNKVKEEGGGAVAASSIIDGPSLKADSANSSVKSERKSYRSHASSEKPMKEFTTLAEYFDSRERANSNSSSPSVDKLINEPHSVEESASRSEDSFAATAAFSPPEAESLPARRPLGNEALDASYRKTMEVLANLPTSRGACRMHVMAQKEAQREGHHKSTRSESKGNKQEVKFDSKQRPMSKESTDFISRQGALKPSCEHDDHSCAIHGVDDPIVVKTMEEDSKDVMTPRQRRPPFKKATTASFEASTVSCKAKATVKSLDEKTLKVPRNARKEPPSKLQGHMVEDSNKLQLPESFTIDSCALQSGNEQGLKMRTGVAPPKVEVVAEAASKMSSNEEAKRWPFEPPVKPRDFKSREDRPLIPGLTTMDWERSFQEAFMHSEPPTNMVLHECSQCGRTFKPESLQVHMRGCRAVNKPRSSPATQRSRRVSL